MIILSRKRVNLRILSLHIIYKFYLIYSQEIFLHTKYILLNNILIILINMEHDINLICHIKLIHLSIYTKNSVQSINKFKFFKLETTAQYELYIEVLGTKI